MNFDPIILSRIQFAFTLSFHILFPALTIGLAGYLVYWEILWLKTNKVFYYNLCRFWSKIFAMAFGMGVISGVVLSYEFGTNFSKFSEITGNILGPLLSYEVLTAFFLEAGFLGIMIFGWNKVSKKLHLFSTCLVAIGTIISAFWIISANSWMHSPTGYYLKDGIFYVKNWKDVIFNPSLPYRFTHMIIASYLATTFLITGISAWYLIRNRSETYGRLIYPSVLLVGLIFSLAQLVIGDLHGLNSFKHQPLKIAAMEGHWETKKSAPFVLFALPDQKKEMNKFEVSIPKLGSLILTHNPNGEVKGLKSVSKDDRPYMPIVFYSFRIMVAIGLWLILTGIIGFILRINNTLFKQRWFHKWCLFSSPLGFIAIIAGWFTTETGRQPWVVYNLLRTKDAASILNPDTVLTSLILFIIIYFVLFSSFIFYLARLVKKRPEEIYPSEMPDYLTAWLEKEDRND
jgi:cytochrome d ubiquinol oxidase subunit I